MILSSILPITFFQRSASIVAPDLLGKQLVREYADGTTTTLSIQEVEAYDGVEDLANHGAKRRTPSNEVMFACGGYFYVYLCYGIHLMLNMVCDQAETPAAVLIRGAGDINGPGKLTKFLEIEKNLNGKLPQPINQVWFIDIGTKVNQSDILVTPRIGLSKYAGKWRDKPLRFVLK